MQRLWIFRTMQILGCILFCCVLVWAQKDEEPVKEGITLADLGVKAKQKTQIDVMWKLKRQKHLQAVKDLKTLNRFVKDTLLSEEELRKTLEKIRKQRVQIQNKIEKAEESLIKTLPPRAQLHLTVLGILDNGLPRRMARTQENKQEGDKGKNTTQTNEIPQDGTEE